MDVTRFVDAKLYAAQPGLLNDTRQFIRLYNRTGFGAGHHSPRAQHTAQPANHPHHIRCGQYDVKIKPAILDPLGQIFAADIVGTGLLGRADAIGAGKDHNTHHATGAVGKRHHAPHLLVGVTGVNTGAQMHLHRLIELGRGAVPHQVNGFSRLVLCIPVDLTTRCVVALAMFGHSTLLVVQTGHRRAPLPPLN